MPWAAEIDVDEMAGAEGVVLALVTAREAADAAELAQPAHAVAPTGQHLVRW